MPRYRLLQRTHRHIALAAWLTANRPLLARQQRALRLPYLLGLAPATGRQTMLPLTPSSTPLLVGSATTWEGEPTPDEETADAQSQALEHPQILPAVRLVTENPVPHAATGRAAEPASARAALFAPPMAIRPSSPAETVAPRTQAQPAHTPRSDEPGAVEPAPHLRLAAGHAADPAPVAATARVFAAAAEDGELAGSAQQATVLPKHPAEQAEAGQSLAVAPPASEGSPGPNLAPPDQARLNPEFPAPGNAVASASPGQTSVADAAPPPQAMRRDAPPGWQSTQEETALGRRADEHTPPQPLQMASHPPATDTPAPQAPLDPASAELPLIGGDGPLAEQLPDREATPLVADPIEAGAASAAMRRGQSAPSGNLAARQHAGGTEDAPHPVPPRERRGQITEFTGTSPVPKRPNVSMLPGERDQTQPNPAVPFPPVAAARRFRTQRDDAPRRSDDTVRQAQVLPETLAAIPNTEALDSVTRISAEAAEPAAGPSTAPASAAGSDFDRSPQAWAARLAAAYPMVVRPGPANTPGPVATPRAAAAPVIAPIRRQEAPADPPGALPDATRRFLRPLLGIDPASVPVHRAAPGDQLLVDENADALAIGDAIVLGSDQAVPTPETLGLLAHELTHVARYRVPRFVPPVARDRHIGAPARQDPLETGDLTVPTDEEALARRVEARVVQEAQRDGSLPLPQSITRRGNDLPSGGLPEVSPVPVAPLSKREDEWNGIELPAPWEPLPTWLAPVATAGMATAISAPNVPVVQPAEHGRSLEEGRTDRALVIPTRPEEAAPEPDLDALARHVYAILKRRLAGERRRVG